MEKKTRKKSKVATTLVVITIIAISITIIATLSTYFMNIAKDNTNTKKYKQEDIKKDDTNILFKINDVYVNQYGFIVNDFNCSAIEVQGITITKNQGQLDTDSSETLSKLLKLRTIFKTYELLDMVDKIDVTNIENVKVYMDSESKIIELGDFENLTTKITYTKRIMEQEKEKSGTIFVNDIEKVYFRENI